MTMYLNGEAVSFDSIGGLKGVHGDVLHDKTLNGNGNTEPLGVDTNIMATTEYVLNKHNEVKDMAENNTVEIAAVREEFAGATDGVITDVARHTEEITELKAADESIKETQSTLSGKVTSHDLKFVNINVELLGKLDKKVGVGNSGRFLKVDSSGNISYVYDVVDHDNTLLGNGTNDDLRVNPDVVAMKTDIPDVSGLAAKSELESKQDKLTAGEGITIDGNTISASGGGGDFLPLSGGELSGPLGINVGKPDVAYGSKVVLYIAGEKYYGGTKGVEITYSPDGGNLALDTGLSLRGGLLSDQIGNVYSPCQTIYVKKINSAVYGTSQDLIVPTEGGTLARLEDIQEAIGTIETALAEV